MPPIVTPPKETDVTVTDAEMTAIAKRVWAVGVSSPPPEELAAHPDVKSWAATSFLKDANLRIRDLQKRDTAQTTAIAQLVTAVATIAASVGDLDPAAIVAELTAALESIDIRIDVPDIPAS
mgnify:CR=1 FL=1